MADPRLVRSFTESRRRPAELGRLPGLSLPWTFSLAQVGVAAAGVLFSALVSRIVGHWWPLLLLLPATAAAAWTVKRVKMDGRSFMRGVLVRVRYVWKRRKYRRLTKRAAAALVGNAMIGEDHSVWLLFSLEPAHYGRLSDSDSALTSLSRAERLVQSVGRGRWKMMSTLEALHASEIARRMSGASRSPTWQTEVDAWEKALESSSLTERKFWLLVDAGKASPPALSAADRVRAALGWSGIARADWADGERLDAMTAEITARVGTALRIRAATVDESVAFLRRVPLGSAEAVAKPSLPDWDMFGFDPPPEAVRVGRSDVIEGGSAWSLGRADWVEERRGMCVAEEAATSERVAHLTAVVSTLPNSWWVPGGGELLWRLDSLSDPWDWLADVQVTPHAVAAAKARNKERALAGQYGEYSGDAAGAPPDLDLAITQIREERAALAANRDSDEYQVTLLMSTSVRVEAGDEGDERAYAVLSERLQRLRGAASAAGCTVEAPAGDQIDARAAWLPKRAQTSILSDYRQYLLADGFAGLAPCQQSRIGDPFGTFLGVSDERGYLEPVLFDPTLGPRAASVGGSPKSPSIGVAGRLGAGKSVFCKRNLWTVLAAGGSCVVVDRSEAGEYVAFAQAVSRLAPELSVEVIDVTDPNGLSIDPMRTISDPSAAADTAVRLLCYMSDLDPRSSVASGIARAAASAAGTPMLEMLKAAGSDADRSEWAPVESLAEVLAADKTGGALFDPDRAAADLTADLVVLHAPGLSLTPSPDTPSDVAATAVVLGTMLVSRALIFASSERFAMLLLDEAWSLFPDARALTVVTEALRDGRKHNSAVCLATQSPADFGVSAELAQLLGYVAMFGASNAAAAGEGADLFGIDRRYANMLVGLPTGTMLWRDVYGRVGMVETWMPADRRAAAAIETTPAVADGK